MNYLDETEIFFQKYILYWSLKNSRNYPWREHRNTYRVFISEIFLQRTKADQVKDVYIDFISIYPNIHSFFNIKEKDIGRYFEKLGLAKRKDYLLKILEILVRTNKKIDDLTDEELMNMPGIGHYSLNAIRCFGDGERRPLVDSNIIRIYHRFFNLYSEKKIPRNDPMIWKFSEKLLPAEKFAEFNYGLIDFGALVCCPKIPNCEICILKEKCHWFSHFSQDLKI